MTRENHITFAVSPITNLFLCRGDRTASLSALVLPVEVYTFLFISSTLFLPSAHAAYHFCLGTVRIISRRGVHSHFRHCVHTRPLARLTLSMPASRGRAYVYVTAIWPRLT